ARQQLTRCPEVDRHDDGADEQARPEGHHPFGAVLGPDDDLVAGRNARLHEPPTERARSRGHLAVAGPSHAIAVVVDDERVVAAGDVLEEIEEAVARHVGLIITGRATPAASGT